SRGIQCELEFSAVTTRYLQSLRPQLFGYELISRGRVVWGNAEVLASARRFPASAIPHWDAWRTLNNRLLEQLLLIEVMESDKRQDLIRLFYQLIKFQIDIGTTLLVFAGRYEDSYAGRAAAFLRWGSEGAGSGAPTFIREMAERIRESTAFKLSPDLACR